MEIKLELVSGKDIALHAMRNPRDSCDMSSKEADKDLCEKLILAGPEHAKHLRMIMCWFTVKAPRYWWQEMDTYKFVEKVSCSTMHTLTKRLLTEDDFECDRKIPYFQLNHLNNLILMYRDIKKSKDNNRAEKLENTMRQLKQSLPESFLQTRTCMTNYAELRNIYRQRKNHRLVEWHKFCHWIEELPDAWMITME